MLSSAIHLMGVWVRIEIATRDHKTTPSWEESPQTNLGFRVHIFLVVRVKEVSHTVVRDLDLVVVLQQDVARCQVPVHHAVLLQVVHALKMDRHAAG